MVSSKAHAKILRVDFAEACKMAGVERYIDHRDVPGRNQIDREEGEEAFAVNEVRYFTSF